MSANNSNFKQLEDEPEQQLPGRDSEIIEKKVKDDLDTTRTVLEHLGNFMEMLTDLFTKMLGGTNTEEREEEVKGDFRADEDDTPQGTSK